MTSDLGSLLERAGAAPLGPLSLTCRPEGNGWSLTVKFGPRQAVVVRAERDAASGGLCLERRVPADAEGWRKLVDSGPWIMGFDTVAAGVVALRLWLHGDGLEVNTLLSALAYFARLDSGGVTEAIGEHLEKEAPTGQVDQLEAKPVAPVRPLAWQSFTTAGRAPAPTDATERQAPASLAEPEAPAVPADRDEPGQEPAVEASETVEASLAVQPSTPPEVSTVTLPTVLPQLAGVSGNCRECGSPHPPDHAFCTTCGARLT